MKTVGIWLVVIIAIICLISINSLNKTTPISPVETTINSPTPKSTPSASEAKLAATMNSPKDGAKMVLIPAGEFLMGTSEEQLTTWLKAHPNDKRESFTNEMPQRKIYLNAFYIYKYEVTVLLYKKFCKETNREMPFEPIRGWVNTHPIVNLTWDDANAYADWAGVTLPTEAQWEKAARGTDGRLYPWGNKWSSKKCVNATYESNPVGSFPAGASPYGVMDMTGNAWELCADWYSADYYQTAPSNNPTGPETGTNHVERGGSWYNFYCDSYGDGFRCADRTYETPYSWGSHGDTEGFRCVLNLQ